MEKSCRLCWGVTILLVLFAVAAGATLFVRGTTALGDDGRTAILLNPAERTHVLAEMRGLLEAVESITYGISQNDLPAVAAAASAVGMGAAGGEPITLIAKLPLEFKSLGMATHSAFDDLALDANDNSDGMALLEHLSGILSNCTSCHAGYRIANLGDGSD